MSDSRPLLMLIDGHALAFRAFHALRDTNMRASSGEPTYGVYGFMSILLSALQEQQPEYLAVSFDIGRTFRDDMYAEYKAGRSETPEEFNPQLNRIKQLVTALNVPIYVAEGFEADDVIGALSRQATEQHVDTLILTGDTDSLQLVDDHVRVLLANPYARGRNTTMYDEAAVIERYKGLKPNQLADLRGLKGDTSDNIPGVKGIGEAGAIALLNQFGTVEQIYDDFALVPKRYQKPLDGQRDTAMFSKKLATIVCDGVPVALDLTAARVRDYSRSQVIALFHELEFGATMLKRLPATDNDTPDDDAQDLPPAPAAVAPRRTPTDTSDDAAFDLPALATDAPGQDDSSPQQMLMFDMPSPAPTRQRALVAVPQVAPPPMAFGIYRSVGTEEQLATVVTALSAASAFAFDTELNGLRPFQDDLVGISIAVEPGIAWYIPFGHREGEQLPRATVLNALRPFFTDAGLPKYAHNAKFDMEALLHAGIEVRGLAFDTMLAAAMVGKRKGLKDLAFYELKLPEPMTPIEDLIGKGKNQIVFGDVPVDTATPYAAADADMTLRLVPPLQAALAEQGKMEQIFTRLEMPLVPVLMRMEAAGIGIDVPYMRDLGKHMAERLSTLEGEIYTYAEREFNINSGAQLADVLFTKLGLNSAGIERTKTGQYSLTAMTLETLRQDHPIIDLILQWRQLTKLKSTYVDALPDLVNPETGRIHTSYSQLGAATGRLSSSDPNLQNIPTRTDDGRFIRRGFTAAPGHVFIAADYSQIELRILAHVTQDENMKAAFIEGQDIHAATASQLFSVPMNAVSKNQRRVAKTVVFGVIYGISSFGLAPRIESSRSEAQALIDALFARFPGLRTYINDTVERGAETGYVRSLFGRRRYFADLGAKGPRGQAARREAVNAPIQSTAADIMKIAMVNVDAALRERNLKTRMLLQVHDELILEAPHDEADEVSKLVCELMAGAHTFDVPLQVDVEAGPNWLDMQDVVTDA